MDAGGEDQPVEPAERLGRLRDQPLGRLRIGHVGGQRDGCAGVRRGLEVGRRDPRAVGQQPLHAGQADAAGGTGDEDLAVGESAHQRLFLSGVGWSCPGTAKAPASAIPVKTGTPA